MERHLPHFRLREQDVRSGYRLLFHRDPTEDEFEHHLHHGWNTGGYDIYHFVEVLLSSSERDEALTRLDEPTAGMLDGMTFYYRPRDTPLGAWTACFGAYETDLADTMENLLRPGGTFLDLGANIGLHTIRAARRVGPKGRVIAVEPNPENHELLRLTIEANGFDQVTVLPVAASDRAGRLAFHVSRGHSNGICQVLPRHWPSDTQTEVPAVRLDDELGFLDQLDLLKIDVEGAEPMALAGMPETLARLRPRILLEFCPHHLLSTAGVDPVEFLASIEAMGYKLLPFVPGEDGAVAVMSPDEILPLPDQHQVSFVNVLADPC